MFRASIARHTLAVAVAATATIFDVAAAQSRSSSTRESLTFPGALRKGERESGNPLATYAAMLGLEQEYRASKVFGDVYDEVRCNYEEFLGDPSAGERAMRLPGLRRRPDATDAPIPEGYEARPAMAVIVAEAARTRIVIWGEEHHLPQTRCLYESLLRELWALGYRHLAAETFTDRVMEPGFSQPDYASGYYLMDPVFAEAVRYALKLGYRLVAYDTSERGPPGDGSFRDRTQAENLVKRIFAGDETAKVLVLCGRGHAAEVPPADGWTPMASVLKRLTGIDPFTVFTPTMTQRLDPVEEDPMYRHATARGLVQGPTFFVRSKDGRCLGSDHFDAHLFLPRVRLEAGRPDWLRTCLGRVATPVPEALTSGRGLRLVQAFPEGVPPAAVPSDQVLLREGSVVPVLMLRPGRYWARTIDAAGKVVGPVPIVIP
jgi:hypothetical protein